MEDYKKANKEIFSNKTQDLDEYIYKHIKDQFKEGAARTNKQAIKAGFVKKEDSQLGGSFFGLNHRKLDALIKSTTDDMKDVKYATLRMANDQYRQTIFKAQVFANTGAGTVKQAIDMATRDFLKKGFDCIEYKDGRRVNIADYCDMAVRTANKRANLMAEGEMMKKLGIKTTYVSKHGGACDKCGKWEGRVYIDDVWADGKSEDGPYPLLSTAIDGGLWHPRCRHGRTIYYEGINNETEEVTEAKNNQEEDDTYTQHLQRQKKKYERLAVGSLLPENILGYENKVNELQNRIDGARIEETIKGAGEVQYIGKLDKNKIGEYKDKIVTDDVIITDERIEHIKEHHPEDYEKYGNYINEIIKNPDYVLEDTKNIDTILFMKTIIEKNKNIQIVVKLNTNKEKANKQNSIITMWKIKEKTYRQFIRNKRNLWKKLDKDE